MRHNGKLNGALSGRVLTLLVLVFLYALFVSVRDLHCTFVSKKLTNREVLIFFYDCYSSKAYRKGFVSSSKLSSLGNLKDRKHTTTT